MQDILQLTSIPDIPKKKLIMHGRLHREFKFLKNKGLIPREQLWDKVRLSFSNDFIEEVMRVPEKYFIHQFRFRNSAGAGKDE
jgi:hypothetical protein